jgi:gluconate 2-dehydrogenase subunit 3-like protein
MIENLSRRNFLTRGSAAVSAVWLSTHWLAIVAAAEHAHQAAKSSTPPKFQFFTPEEAVEIDAIASRIIPSDETPGAREAGVVYFIDRALATFAVDDQKTYREGLPGLQLRVSELFPSVEKFSSATPEQQDQILHALDDQTGPARRHSRSAGASSSFFQAVRVHTIVAFLVDPDSGGNRDGVGWKVIGREPEHVFQPPFGYYDKDYAGWQPNPPDAEKTKA